MGIKIYTIGHSNLTFKEFERLLQAYDIELVIDVRSIPYSRYNPQFNREELQRELEHSRIDYQYLGDLLGGKPQDPKCYTGGKPIYEKIAEKESYKLGLRQLLEIASKRRAAIMCSEEDPYRCHRHRLIAQTLLDLNEDEEIEVLHIRSDGSLERAERLEKQLSFFQEDG